MDGGHFIGGRTNSVLFVEDNIHPQCQRCNKWANSSDAATAYGLYMVDRYGIERVKDLQQMRHASEWFSKDELLDMRDEYLKRIKLELDRLERMFK